MRIDDLKIGDVFQFLEDTQFEIHGATAGIELRKERNFLVTRSPYSSWDSRESIMHVEILPVEGSGGPLIIVREASVLILVLVGYTNPEVRKIEQLRMAFIR